MVIVGRLETRETLALNTLTPHIQVTVNLGKHENAAPLTLITWGEELGTADAKPQLIRISRPGVRLSFATNPAQAFAYNLDATAKQMLQQYDKDNNGYLDAKEMAGNLAAQFESWDADGDGKVFLKEIVEAYNRSMAPQMSQVRASVEIQNNALFQALDLSGDGVIEPKEAEAAK